MKSGEICIYCLSGIVRGGVCSNCGMPAADDSARPIQALPARHMLCGGQYLLGRVLGSGGFGITYFALDQKNNRKVAIKEFFPRYLATRDNNGRSLIVHQEYQAEFQHAKTRFRQEAQKLYELRNIPEIINVFHLFEENGTVYYVMEFLNGQDMKGYLAKNGAMTWAQMQPAAGMVLRALDAVHKKDMIHRDISPDNIFMLRGGGAKLIDFGNARNYTSGNALTKIVKTRFAPVEQFSDDKGRQGPWTDIYSLSVTMYYALSGVLPPMSTERLFALKTQRMDPVKPLESLKPNIPAHVIQGINKGMAVMEKQRYQTVAEFAKQLFPGMDILRSTEPSAKSNGISNERKGTVSIRCVQGLMRGKEFTLNTGSMNTVGRARDAVILYPMESLGISRHQCTLIRDYKGVLYVRDDNSAFGTELNGQKLEPMKWYSLKKGDSICFAKEEYRVL